MAGHSKWANIKHRKAAQDKKRGKIWSKLIREVTVAAREADVAWITSDNPRSEEPGGICRDIMAGFDEVVEPRAAGRELVIDRALALDTPALTVEELKWIVLLVLMNRPGREAAFTQMEEMVYNSAPAYLH